MENELIKVWIVVLHGNPLGVYKNKEDADKLINDCCVGARDTYRRLFSLFERVIE